MKTFILLRTEDASGISGVGNVAEGIEFSNGKCALCWIASYQSVAVYDNLADLVAVHGHDGKTEIVWTKPD